MQASQVYVNAWSSVKRIVSRCFQNGIGVLLDFHAVPGGANKEEHSGTCSGKAELWGDRFNLDLTTRCLRFMAEEVASSLELAGVIGIQLCNESLWDPPGMYPWYDRAISELSNISNTLPIYISDGWDLNRALQYAKEKNSVHQNHCPIIVDTHKYYTFSAKDTSRSPYDLIGQVWTELGELDAMSGNVFDHTGAVAIYVGEYSCALAPQTWEKAPADEKEGLMRRFGNAQCSMWQAKASGSAFWTLKMDWMDGWEWGFKHQSNAGAVVAPKCMGLSGREVGDRLKKAEGERGARMTNAMDAHCEFWDRTAGKQGFEHWRFADGWHLGWSDARDFFGARLGRTVPSRGGSGRYGHADESAMSMETGDGLVGADKIGALDLWVLKRMKEQRVARRDECPFGWEWEQGFRAGVRAFEECVSV